MNQRTLEARMVTPKDEKRYWLWVAQPQNYQDEDGNDLEILKPGKRNKPEDWWTCHRDTRKGDLALMWRTKRADIGFLMKAESDAYPLTDYPWAIKAGWKWGCDWKVLYKFQQPLKIQEIRARTSFRDWSANKANFQHNTFSIPLKTWKRLNQLLARKNHGYQEFLENIEETLGSRKIKMEQITEALGNLSEAPHHRRTPKLLLLVQRNHNKLSNAFVNWLRRNGYTDVHQEQAQVDVRFRKGKNLYCAELKTIGVLDTTQAIRQALGQLLEYNYYPGREHHKRWAIILDEQPKSSDIAFIRRLKTSLELPLFLGWHEARDFVFGDKLDL
jgi:hypothetical protein